MQSKCLELEEERRRVEGKKDAEQLLKVRREKKSWVSRMQSCCLELAEEQRRVEGTRMQRICLEQDERRVEGTRMQRSCLE